MRKTGQRPPPTRVGCAGWALSSQVAADFPGPGSHLERYARVFSCVEINSSFHRPHQPATYTRWAASVPDSFRFSVKLPREITHTRRLHDCDAALDAFLGQAGCLGPTLGYLLVQLPPSLALDVEHAGAFLRALRERTGVPVALEARHRSWFGAQAIELAQAWRIDRVLAHPAPVADIDAADMPRPAYVRLHGAPRMYYSAYEDAFIDELAAQLRAAPAPAHAQAVWCVFDNTAHGAAIPNALAVMARLAP